MAQGNFLFILLISLVFCGCETVSTEGYRDSRREAGSFQVADQPVHRFRVLPKNTAGVVEEEPVMSFELPEVTTSQPKVKVIDAQPIRVYPKKVQPQVYQPRKATSAKKYVPETKLPLGKAQSNLSKKDIQIVLKQLGYYQGKIDGVLGPQSKAAIRKFQKSRGLVVDGVAGKRTKAALVSQLRAKIRKN